MAIPKIPVDLKINESHWKYLLWAINKGKNVLLYGMSGSGKTLAAIKAAEAISNIIHEKVVTEDELEKMKLDKSIEIIEETEI